MKPAAPDTAVLFDTSSDGAIDTLKKSIDTRLTDLVSSQQHEYGPYSSPSSSDPAAAHDIFLSAAGNQAAASSHGGKRLRALLMLSLCGCLGMPDTRRQQALDLACAIEVFQTAALIHDDIIDDSDTRRGAPSAHKALGYALGSRRPGIDSASAGMGMAIMLGDILATDSVAIAHRSGLAFSNSQEITAAFLDMHHRVETGQIMDLSMGSLDLTDPDSIETGALETYLWKTASYTAYAPIQLAFLACAFDAEISARMAHTVGKPLGLAFQLNDDLIDVTSRTSGKPLGGDILEGKRTVLLSDALRLSDTSDRRTLINIYSRNRRSRDDTPVVCRIFESSGAIERSRERISRLFTEASSALEDGLSALHIPDSRISAVVHVMGLFV